MNDELKTDYELHLTPHRSLPKRGFLLLMGGIALFSFLAGLYFWQLGAWPVTGFFGLDFLMIYLVFRWTYHTGRAREIIQIKDGVLEVLSISPAGDIHKTVLQAYWLRAQMHNERLFLTSHGSSTQIGAFLALEEKQAVCAALVEKLRACRSGNPIS